MERHSRSTADAGRGRHQGKGLHDLNKLVQVEVDDEVLRLWSVVECMAQAMPPKLRETINFFMRRGRVSLVESGHGGGSGDGGTKHTTLPRASKDLFFPLGSEAIPDSSVIDDTTAIRLEGRVDAHARETAQLRIVLARHEKEMDELKADLETLATRLETVAGATAAGIGGTAGRCVTLAAGEGTLFAANGRCRDNSGNLNRLSSAAEPPLESMCKDMQRNLRADLEQAEAERERGLAQLREHFESRLAALERQAGHDLRASAGASVGCVSGGGAVATGGAMTRQRSGDSVRPSAHGLGELRPPLTRIQSAGAQRRPHGLCGGGGGGAVAAAVGGVRNRRPS